MSKYINMLDKNNISEVLECRENGKAVSVQSLVGDMTNFPKPLTRNGNPGDCIKGMYDTIDLGISRDSDTSSITSSSYDRVDVESGIHSAISNLSGVESTCTESVQLLSLSHKLKELQKENVFLKEKNEELSKVRQEDDLKDFEISKLKEDLEKVTQALPIACVEGINAVLVPVINALNTSVTEWSKVRNDQRIEESEKYEDLNMKYFRVKNNLTEKENELKHLRVKGMKTQRYIKHIVREQKREVQYLQSTIGRMKRRHYNESNWMQGEIQVLKNENWNMKNSSTNDFNLNERLILTTNKLKKCENDIKMRDLNLLYFQGKVEESEQELVNLRENYSSKNNSEVVIVNLSQKEKELAILKKDFEKLKNSSKGKEKSFKSKLKEKDETICDITNLNTNLEKWYNDQYEELKTLKLKRIRTRDKSNIDPESWEKDDVGIQNYSEENSKRKEKVVLDDDDNQDKLKISFSLKTIKYEW